MSSINTTSPMTARTMIRKNEWLKPTSGLANGYIQGNLAVLPKDLAFDFLLFCQRNPKSCPIIDVTEPRGQASPALVLLRLYTLRLMGTL